jgi:tetratricopeptide (TPR) repeat protein
MSDASAAEHQHSAGIAALQAGDMVMAVQCLRAATALAPSLPRNWSNLGEALRRSGALAEAVQAFDHCVQLDAGYAKGWRGLGAALFGLQRLDAAQSAFAQWLALGEDTASAQAFIADCQRVRGQTLRAIAGYRAALAIDHRHRHSLLNLPHVLLMTGAEEEALALAVEALAQWPDDVELLISAGCCLKTLERFEEAMDYFADAWDRDASSLSLCCLIAEVWEELGDLIQADLWLARARGMDGASVDVRLRQASLLRAAEQPDDALAMIAELLVEHPDHIDVWLQKARAEFDAGDADAALASYRVLTARQPDNVVHDIAMAHVQVALGHLDAAADGFRSALSKNPRALAAIAGLASTLRAKLQSSELESLHHALQRREMPDNVRAQLLMGLAMVQDGRGEHAAAAVAAIESNRLQAEHGQRRHRGYKPEDFDRQVDTLQEIFSVECIAALRRHGNPDPRPTFIIGMPRSGTTLTEQILNAHPVILGIGERSFAQRSLLRATASKNIDAALAVLAEHQDCDIAATAAWHLDKLQALAQSAASAPQRIVDKMPDNYLWAGFLHALFPNARLIYLRRDPRDIALSNWMNLFAQIRWANDLEHIAGRLIGHHRLMQHWRSVLPPGVLIEVDYEALAADPETQARRLIAALGLEWDPACMEFHQQRNLVRTASVTQVREPVYTRSVARWRHYAEVLAPLSERLRDAGLLGAASE